MADTYIPRTIEPVLRRAAREFPAVVVTGPRQCGKTTLLRTLFARTHRYISLDAADVCASAIADPRGFLARHAPPVIIDEVQNAPELLPYLKERIDAERSSNGRFLLTGSQNLLMMERVTESLAGRSAILRLLPFSAREAGGLAQALLPWENAGRKPTAPPSSRPIWPALVRGGYPDLVAHPRRDAGTWHASYVQTYLERDVRSLRQIGDLSQFQDFVRLLAARSGQLLVLSGLAHDLGVAVNTAKAWLSVLEATWQVVVLRPYFANVGKRLVKTPKIYFTDTGTLCHLAGLTDPTHAAAGPLGGTIFESAVLSEIVKGFVHRGQQPRVWFWRTSIGVEVDFLVEHAGRLVPIEVKLTSTPRPPAAAGIAAVRRDLGQRVADGFVVHGGEHELSLGEGVLALPLRRFLS